MLQYLQNVMKLQLAGYKVVFLTPRRLLQASRTWTLCDGYVDFLRRLCEGDICRCKLFHCWKFRKFHLKFLPNHCFFAPLFEMYLSQTQTLTTQTFVTSESRKILVGLWTWKTSPSPVLNGGAWGGPKFLKASGMQHTMPGAKTPNKGWW